ncbi:MAG: YicC family protein [Nitrospirae bacterium CG18_big_fil_WC_8_21_14_2_50_70_55]|nr:YicC family protein [Deltaproteobacteria bacterium]OIP67192.1 MAG: YicC family protein [Nitrospirae bacterium CG2_30_70_394]PIQ04866.1 MAG: YicC family protein [Nitrospirae bacterium CG18_big_fil_WC_8_21_14_2_50_70_55]PIU78115.1 MAG: YicC family protein [Nitrospirae bacterium CG06_land_8_20_14_3_00_70_43]PIW82147.1 MAG: YicC family protein [Nitrospirae bacterium CG_4_8_14_3_um_filter_70_85]PIX83433.1 MAG: YicC family protein [Nitrospirae bacterium CG_4_10_14_3_um_filter_70_108]PJB97054.1 M
MVHSMTGFGRGDGRGGVQVELRSVNHRYGEVVCRLPRELLGLEERLKEQVGRRLRRGRVELFLARPLAVGGGRLCVDTEGLKEAVGALRMVKEAAEVEGEIDLGLLLGFREFFTIQVGSVDEESVWLEIEPPLAEAIQQWDMARRREGAQLVVDLRHRLATLATLVAEVEGEAGGVREELGERVRARVAELGVEVEAGRLEQEVALLAMRADIQEEVIRLRAHLATFTAALEADGPVGRRLDFLCQEMVRETNTIGSKSSRLSITERVMRLKETIEQVREQVQNLE